MNLNKEKLIINSATFFMQKYIDKHLKIGKNKGKIPVCDDKNKKLLYIHLPFCTMFCTYFYFNKYIYDKEKSKEYFKSLREEILHVKELGYDFDKLVIGGGTPLIDEDELLKTIELSKSLFSIKHVSCESDPNHIDIKTLDKFKGLIDRLSIGVQTFDDSILAKLGRFEKFGSAKEVYEKIEKIIGVLPTISVDLIFNFPAQTQKGLINDLEILKKLSPQQTSLYPLMTSKAVKNSIRKTLGKFNLDNEYKFFNIIKENLKDAYPFRQGWSFSKETKQEIDEYVIENDDYIGVGSGSFSFLKNVLYVNEFLLEEYIKLIKTQKSAVTKKQEFTIKSQMYYRIMVGLFGGHLSKNSFKTFFGKNIENSLKSELSLLKLSNAIKEDKDEIKTTPFGDYLFVTLMKEFYIGMDKIRQSERKKILIS
ncbi:MAG: coproporphyrinogen III oxidase family protein [Campylobacteraceae bacterium]